MAPRKEKTEKATADQGDDNHLISPEIQDLIVRSRDCNDSRLPEYAVP